MVEVVVTGIGLVSALGSTLTQTWQSLQAGKSAIALRQPFLDLPPLPLALIGKTPVSLSTLIAQVVPAALWDAQLQGPLPDCGIVLGSSRSKLAEWEALAYRHRQRQALLPQDWIQALPHQGALEAARLVGSHGPILAPMAACATGIWALAQAYELIQSGQCERVIAGAVEAPITPLCLAGFAKMGALAKTGCYPFDRQREGLVPGEGAAIMVLETATAAQRRGAVPYGQILGFGLGNDAYHVSSPEPGYGSAIATIKQCLTRSQLAPEQVDYIHAHGTATALNDQMEAAIVGQLFPSEVLLSSTKGALGHTLGASGAMSTALSLMALRQQTLLPCVGLQEPAFALNLIRKADVARLDTILCFSFGFGGQNAVVSLGQTGYSK